MGRSPLVFRATKGVTPSPFFTTYEGIAVSAFLCVADSGSDCLLHFDFRFRLAPVRTPYPV